jgi:CheY-like chemotaxis protein
MVISMVNVEKDTRLYENLQEVLQAGGRAVDLVKQILTFSRQTEQERKPVQVKLIVKEALKLLRSSLPTTIEVRQDIQSESLVLADPTQIHQILMNLCTNAGHAMEIEALELFKAKPDRFDLVITDMTMPHMTGDDLARELMRIKPAIPVILCTGFSAKIDDRKAMAMGVQAFVFKPVVKRDIAQTVRKVLDGK